MMDKNKNNGQNSIGFIFAPNIAGIDEAGRGPLCGPVIAAAVCFSQNEIPEKLINMRDSKKISAQKRVFFAELIKNHADFSYGAASVSEIDRLNILKASLLAMRRAAARLKCAPKEFWIDGNYVPDLIGAPATAIIKGDNSHYPIIAASILAKTLRDHLMQKLAKKYPHYQWQDNKGYGSKTHLNALEIYGATRHHRTSFAPIKYM